MLAKDKFKHVDWCNLKNKTGVDFSKVRIDGLARASTLVKDLSRLDKIGEKIDTLSTERRIIKLRLLQGVEEL